MKIDVKKLVLDHISRNTIKAISKTKSNSGGVVRKPDLFHHRVSLAILTHRNERSN